MDLVWIKLMRGNKLTKNPLHQWLVDSFHGKYFYNTLPKTSSEFGTISTFFYGGGELANLPQLSHSCAHPSEMCPSAFKAKCKDHISLVVIEKAHCRCQNQRQTQTTVTNPETTTDDAKNDWSLTSPSSYRHKPLNHHLLQLCLFHSFPRWWFQRFLMFIPTWGRFPIWRAYVWKWKPPTIDKQIFAVDGSFNPAITSGLGCKRSTGAMRRFWSCLY